MSGTCVHSMVIYMVKTVTASLSISVLVECPHCDSMIDLLNADDTAGFNHDEAGSVISQACPDGSWSEAHKKFEVTAVECSECGKSFDVSGLDW